MAFDGFMKQATVHDHVGQAPWQDPGDEQVGRGTEGELFISPVVWRPRHELHATGTYR